MTADEALAYFEDLNSSFISSNGDNNDERFSTNATLVLQPSVEPYAGASIEIPDYGLGKSGNIVAHAITRSVTRYSGRGRQLFHVTIVVKVVNG